MIQFFKNLLEAKSEENINDLLLRGALVIDVRTESEFELGNAPGSVNVPLDQLQQNISRFNKNKPIITCCASGIRSATAKRILTNNGFNQVYNGGSWINMKREMSHSS
jgi:rhodanese-related sulfurtransferase